ncbi:hypothetical protein PRIPAC_95866 [Pristionchus pacificus]|uniref:Uncharacterized protein n=1 Tax=Pristionchus pacificus TaxID=54126 RepID=A0A2A6CGR6_PRIPA|nr:hypothetical protein PRIPAC_95866 [Pristionchus pacificus]|eukprot:PDM77415.1 hypothetical protein PRIPAC_33145 [Pristionchus pacificus]
MLRERNCNVQVPPRPVVTNERLLVPAPIGDGSDLENADSTSIKLRIRLAKNPRFSTCTIITYTRCGRQLIIHGVRNHVSAPKKQKSKSVICKSKKNLGTKSLLKN